MANKKMATPLALVLADSHEIQNIVSPEAYSTLAFWDKLNEGEQEIVVAEGRLLAQAMLQFGTSRLAIGERLTKLQGILEPHNIFGKFLRNFHFSKRTAYRYIKAFEHAKNLLPATILTAAMVRGVNIVGENDIRPLGAYTSAVAKLPPPKNATEIQANTWLDQIENVKKEERGGGTMFTMPAPSDPQTLLKECYRFVSLRYKRLPNSTATRSKWIKSFVGLVLSDLGVAGQQTFVPQNVPDEFKVQRGRPPLVAAA